MLRKLFLCALSLALFNVAALAQDDYNKAEGFVGYSNNQVETGIADDVRSFNTTTNQFDDDFFDKRQGFHGVNAAGTFNFNRYVGVRGDFSANYKNFRTNLPLTVGSVTSNSELRVNASVYNFLGGIQVKDNAKEGSRFRPFGYALAGAGVNRAKIDEDFFSTSFCQRAGVDCRNGFDESETGFAAALGGGIDIRATRRFSIRAVQIDYNPIRVGGSTQDNIRFGFGVVFH